ncbi:hypothetical protein [Dactylosporangium matsuzakiense]|uniref:hypothetical protein n=1 Tax=Dactylosporangium matsuzakiense TaxID=53360 RepID=UPI0021C2E294|nr:hypothetical protein [Dactylosporangium matsuzakiense]UWZ42061.1 hypothetical protein Dmats_31205 [Dactylosporangium matsuzakiense]
MQVARTPTRSGDGTPVVAARRVAPARCGVAALAALCALTGGQTPPVRADEQADAAGREGMWPAGADVGRAWRRALLTAVGRQQRSGPVGRLGCRLDAVMAEAAGLSGMPGVWAAGTPAGRGAAGRADRPDAWPRWQSAQAEVAGL